MACAQIAQRALAVMADRFKTRHHSAGRAVGCVDSKVAVLSEPGHNLRPASGQFADGQIQTYGYGGTANAPGGKNAAGVVIASGGFDPYISLFQGSGSSGTLFASNDDGSCPFGATDLGLCHDSTLKLILPAGSYTLTLTVFENFSFAENLGSGTLGDGFIGLGNYFDLTSGTLRSPNYAVDIKIPLLVSSQVNVIQKWLCTKSPDRDLDGHPDCYQHQFRAYCWPHYGALVRLVEKGPPSGFLGIGVLRQASPWTRDPVPEHSDGPPASQS
jgi:hypothetical protein